MDQRKLRSLSITAMVAGLLGGMGSNASLGMRSAPAPKRRTRVPMMVTAPAEEIAAWNAKVDQDNRAAVARLASQRRDRRLAKALKDNGQHPKFPKARVHKQAKHPLRDEHGAITLVGKPYELVGVHPTSRELVLEGWVDGEDYGYTVQHKWLAGISAQRGY